MTREVSDRREKGWRSYGRKKLGRSGDGVSSRRLKSFIAGTLRILIKKRFLRGFSASGLIALPITARLTVRSCFERTGSVEARLGR
jgi:hypothetical protein